MPIYQRQKNIISGALMMCGGRNEILRVCGVLENYKDRVIFLDKNIGSPELFFNICIFHSKC